jgi:hypothetical protein
MVKALRPIWPPEQSGTPPAATLGAVDTARLAARLGATEAAAGVAAGAAGVGAPGVLTGGVVAPADPQAATTKLRMRADEIRTKRGRDEVMGSSLWAAGLRSEERTLPERIVAGTAHAAKLGHECPVP